ncbi:ATP-dependent helicase/nuclease subunit [Trichinella spiralis]|uniref:ATP-dependent helicase/nuclease subunit n=1 Tax=Trichinella spiralis TaxID=6334 RepID=A0ABR3K9F8_TRISP
MDNKSFNISDLANQNGKTVQPHGEHDTSIDYTIMCLSILAVIVNASLLFSMYKNNTMRNRIFITAYAIGTSTTGLAFAIGYYYRIINHGVRFQTTSLRICMTKTPHISLIADPKHWNSKVPAVCFLRTTVPKRIKAKAASVRFLLFLYDNRANNCAPHMALLSQVNSTSRTFMGILCQQFVYLRCCLFTFDCKMLLNIFEAFPLASSKHKCDQQSPLS